MRTRPACAATGTFGVIPASEMVPGDIVLVEAGDAISADLRLVEASNIAADESTLTGESVAVDKTCAPGRRRRTAWPTAGRCCSRARRVTRGSGIGVVAATGLATELGRVSQLVEEAEAGSSPLEKNLARLSAQLVWATLVLTALIAGRRPRHGRGPLAHGRGGDRLGGGGDPGRAADRRDA